jgi:hypothetical protein
VAVNKPRALKFRAHKLTNKLIENSKFKCKKTYLTPKVLRGQILAFAVFGHVAVIRRCDMIFGEFYSR